MERLTTLRLMVERFRDNGDEPALIALHDDRIDVRPFSAVAHDVERLASGLVQAGVKKGEPVGVYADGGPDWIIAFLAIVTAGGVAVPFDISLKGPALAGPLGNSGCRHVFVGARQVEALRNIDSVDIEALYLLGDEAAGGASNTIPWRKLGPKTTSTFPALEACDQAALFYTSGTTGAPKGVPLTHANLMSNINSLVAERMLTTADRVLLPLPPHHVYPLVVGALAPLASGAAIVFPAGISGPQLVDALHRGEASVLIGVPRLYGSLLEAIEARLNNLSGIAKVSIQALSGLQRVMPNRAGRFIGRAVFRRLRSAIGPRLWLLASGGASLGIETWCALERFGWTVLTGYGLTETAPILTFNPLGRSKIGSTGKALLDVEIRIANPNEHGVGEIEARGPSVFSGYRDRPQETAAAFTTDGWFRTGDLGRLDDDGFLYVVGRSKELIVLPDGKNVFPETIEEVYSAGPLIREIAVFEDGGNLIGLVVPDLDQLRARGAESAVQLIHDEIRDLSPLLAPHQRLSGHVLTQTPLPRTAIGKLKRHQLAGLYRNACEGTAPSAHKLTKEDDVFLSEPQANEIWRWLNHRFPDQPLTLDVSPQLDLSIDSLGWMGVSLEIGDRFGVCLSEEQIARIVTLRDLISEIKVVSATPPPAGETSPQQARFLAPPGFMQRSCNFVLYGFFRMAMRWLFRLQVTGLQNLPIEGPFIIAPNHASWLDPIAIAASLSYGQARRTRFAGWTGIMFRSVVSRALSWAAGVFPVDPNRAAANSLSLARDILDRGHILVWFPEGRRTRTGSLLPFQAGVGALLEGTEIAVVPTYIDGSFHAAPPGRLMPRLASITVRFGAPQTAAVLMKSSRGETTPQHISDALHSVVAALGDTDCPTQEPLAADQHDA